MLLVIMGQSACIFAVGNIYSHYNYKQRKVKRFGGYACRMLLDIL